MFKTSIMYYFHFVKGFLKALTKKNTIVVKIS